MNDFFNTSKSLFDDKYTANILYHFFINFEIKLRFNSLQLLRGHIAFLLCNLSERTLIIPKSKIVILSRINYKDTGNIPTRF